MVAGLNLPDPQKAEKKKSKHGQEDKVISNNAMLIDAKKEAIIGNTAGARELFQRYLNRYPEDPVAYFELARIESDLGNAREAIRLCEEATRLDPSNNWYAIFLAELYQTSSRLPEAIDLYEKITEKDPDNLDDLYQLAALYLQVEKYRDAIRIYDLIEGKAGVSEEISVQKEKIYLHLNDMKNAEKEIRSLIAAFPGESRYLSILAEFYMANNMPEKALETYKKVAETDPGNAYIHMSLADYYRKTGDKEKAFEELRLGFANPNLDVDSKVSILLSFYNVNELYTGLKEQAFTLSKILVDTHPKDPKVYSIYGDLLAQDKQYEEARQAFLKVLNLDSGRYAVWEQVLRLDMQVDKYDHLVTYGNKAIELFPEQPLIYLLTGLGSYQLHKYQDALKVLAAGAKLVADDNELLSQFYMYLGDSHHALKQDDDAFRFYEKSIQLKDDNAYVLNNYAYYLSLRGNELEKAGKMAQKAVKLEPENPSFQDTYGWVLFMQGNYNEANVWIEKAVRNSKEEPSAELLEHYGDVLYKLGNQSGALEYWMKAKAKGPGSDLLDKKINDKKYYR
jgi:tetratricopeptide (TPR) repeat protein